MSYSTVFTYGQFQSMLESFASRMPETLSRMPETAYLAGKLDSLLEDSSTPFTVAVMGQMRSGKSTLLNALIGQDLAITGVNETTATVNCFKYSGNAEDCRRFRVLWKNAPEQFLPIDQIGTWIGDSANAAQTNRLEFYAASEFLKTANIIDTPGTRSTITEHTSALSDFLHDESVRQGGKADAIIYVLLPVGRENDEKWLAEFEQASRMPGATPYNSLAVVHKWEATLDVGDPVGTAAAKADKIRDMLAGQVSRVISVSAPLAILSERLGDDRAFWATLILLGRESKPDVIELITMSEDYYACDVEGCSLPPAAREDLRNRAAAAYPGMPWPSFKTLIRAAAAADVGTPEDLHSKIVTMSGFGTLRKELEDRYFARSRVIKAFSLLAKAWKPCQTAQTILRNLKAELDRTIREGDEGLNVLEPRIQYEPELLPAVEYIRKSRCSLETRFRAAQSTLAELGDAIIPIQTAFEDMQSELAAIEILDERNNDFPTDILPAIRLLLGVGGTEVEARIKAIRSDSPTADDFASLCGKLRILKRQLPAELSKPVDVAIIRAEQIADWLESTVSDDESGW